MPLILKIWIVLRWMTNHTLSLIRRHPRFSECLLLGFLGAFLLSLIPLIGHFLAAVAIALAFFLRCIRGPRRYRDRSVEP
jgi:hypothetical protein